MRLILMVALALVELFNPLAAEAQPAEKIARIGYLSLNVGAGEGGYLFREARAPSLATCLSNNRRSSS